MLRKLVPFLPLILLFLAYGFWVFIAPRLNIHPKGKSTPWTFLFATAIGLAVVSMIGLSFFDGANIDSHYNSPRLEDGKVVPGKFTPNKP